MFAERCCSGQGAELESLDLAPSGTGGLLEAVKRDTRVLHALMAHEYVQIVSVDNAINQVLDPIQLGYSHANGLDVAVKACAKTAPTEPLGVIGMRNGLYNISSDVQEKGSNLGYIGEQLCRSSFLMKLS